MPLLNFLRLLLFLIPAGQTVTIRRAAWAGRLDAPSLSAQVARRSLPAGAGMAHRVVPLSHNGSVQTVTSEFLSADPLSPATHLHLVVLNYVLPPQTAHLWARGEEWIVGSNQSSSKTSSAKACAASTCQPLAAVCFLRGSSVQQHRPQPSLCCIVLLWCASCLCNTNWLSSLEV